MYSKIVNTIYAIQRSKKDGFELALDKKEKLNSATRYLCIRGSRCQGTCVVLTMRTIRVASDREKKKNYRENSINPRPRSIINLPAVSSRIALASPVSVAERNINSFFLNAVFQIVSPL